MSEGEPMIKLCVDSGAFSAFTQKKVVDLNAYCDFLTSNSQHIYKSVCLDVIDPEGPDVAAAKGWDNYLRMRDRGLNPMPVFHAREHWRWLDQMLDKTDYIGLSGTSLVSPLEHIQFYNLCWQYVTDRNGCPIAKFHAFGDTSAYSLSTYPWYSADSATWVIQSGRAARVKLQGKAYQLRSNSIRDTSYVDVNDPLPKKQEWEKEIRALGLDPDIVMNIKATPSEMAMIRSYLLAADVLRLGENTKNVTRYTSTRSLLAKKRQQEGGAARVGPCNIYFVISPAAWYFNLPVLAALDIRLALVSYYYIVTAPASFWPERFLPFLYDPKGFCSNNPKVKKYWDKLQECILKLGIETTV